jgi:hypothetical protein
MTYIKTSCSDREAGKGLDITADHRDDLQYIKTTSSDRDQTEGGMGWI